MSVSIVHWFLLLSGCFLRIILKFSFITSFCLLNITGAMESTSLVTFLCLLLFVVVVVFTPFLTIFSLPPESVASYQEWISCLKVPSQATWIA